MEWARACVWGIFPQTLSPIHALEAWEGFLVLGFTGGLSLGQGVEFECSRRGQIIGAQLNRVLRLDHSRNMLPALVSFFEQVSGLGYLGQFWKS